MPHPHACAGVTQRVRPAAFFYNRSEILVQVFGEAAVAADAPERPLPSADAAAATNAPAPPPTPPPAFGFDLDLMRVAERSRRIIDELGGVAALAKVDAPRHSLARQP